MRGRQGYTLVECLAAIGLIAVTFSTVAVSIGGMVRSCQRIREELVTELALERFAAQLRADAHRASTVKLEPAANSHNNATTLVLTLSDERSVRYTMRAMGIERVLNEGNDVRHHETYRLRASFTARWEVQRDHLLPVASLTLASGPVGLSSPLGFQQVRIEAAVGLLQSSLARNRS